VALDGGKDGLSLIRKLLILAGSFLSSGGIMLVEIDERQGESALELAQIYFKDARSCLHKDFSGFDRVLSIQT
jgi:release factor glutamine methyltransferase